MIEHSDQQERVHVQRIPLEQDREHTDLQHKDRTSLVCIAVTDEGLEEAGTLLKAWVPDVPLSIIVVTTSSAQVTYLQKQLDSVQTFTIDTPSHSTEIRPGHIYILSPSTSFTFKESTLEAVDTPKPESFPGEQFLTTYGRSQKQETLLILFAESLADYSNTIKLLGSCYASIIHHSKSNSSSVSHEEVPLHHLVDRSYSLEEVAVYTQHFIESFNSNSIAELEKNPQSVSYVQHLISILGDHSANTYTHINPSYILLHVFQRLRLLGHSSIHDYIERLATNEEEIARLAKRFSLRNTFFFNDLRSLRVIAKTILPSLAKESAPDHVIRVWVPGSGSGEDVLSLSMLIHEHADSPQTSTKIRLLGTEVDEQVLQFARKPKYSKVGLNKIPDILKGKFFANSDTAFEFEPAYLAQCHYSLLHPTTAAPFTGVDIIYCKDILPTLTQKARKTLLHHFRHSLSSKGILVIGSNEAGNFDLPFFSPVNNQPFILRPTRESVEDSTNSPSINLFRNSDEASKPLQNPSETAQRPLVESDRQESLEKNSIHSLHKDLLLQIKAPVSVMIRSDFTIVDHIGNVGRFISWPNNGHTVNMLEAFPKEVQEDLRFAVNQVLKSKIALKSRPIRTGYEGIFREFRLQVHPINLDDAENNLIQVIFLETDPSTAKHTLLASPTEDTQSEELDQLKSELDDTKEKLRVVSSLLKDSKELLKNAKTREKEALETAARQNSPNEYQKLVRQNEELRSTNTELLELNRDLVRRIEELRKSMNRKMKEFEQANAEKKPEKVPDSLASFGKSIELFLPKRHEVRTALTSIIGFADLLADRIVDKDNRELARYIGKSGHRLSENLAPLLNSDIPDPEPEIEITEETDYLDDVISSDRVLVVEDSEATRRLLTLVLSDRFDCEVASDGSEAIEKAEKEIFKAVLLDIDLGKGPNGIDVLDHLRQKNYYRTVPFMAVTSMATPQDRSMLLRKGFDAFVPKPFQKGQLLSTLDKIIDNSGMIA